MKSSLKLLFRKTSYNDQRAVMEGSVVATTKDISDIGKSGKAPEEK